MKTDEHGSPPRPFWKAGGGDPSVFICVHLWFPLAMQTTRLTAHPLRLIVQAIGGRRQLAGKLRRLARTLRLQIGPPENERRPRTLGSKRYVSPRPTRLQI